jgi:hypothetical protein
MYNHIWMYKQGGPPVAGGCNDSLVSTGTVRWIRVHSVRSDQDIDRLTGNPLTLSGGEDVKISEGYFNFY